MLQKKICMLGSFAVGKTSLVRRFVESIYSDTYQTTIGVRIDKKNLLVEGRELTLLLWDIYGEDDYQKTRWSYLKGASGFLLVADGTRRATLEKAILLEEKARQEVGPLPFVFVMNKCDLSGEWQIDENWDVRLAALQWTTLRSSAKTGEGVENAFQQLAGKMLG
jgi:small GTP-binding protein